MAVEMNAVEIEDFALLKFGAAPDRRERRQMRSVGAICRAQPKDHRPVLLRHRIEVIDRFEIAGEKFLLRFLDFLLLAFHELLHLHLLRHRAIEPIHAGHVGAVIEAQRRIVAQELRDRDRMLVIDQKRRLIAPGRRIGNDRRSSRRARRLRCAL